MRRKKHKHSPPRIQGGGSPAVESDFYAGSPSERPLHQDRSESDANRVRKTSRHQAAAGRRKETVDPREKMALLAILKSTVMILLLLILFFILWKGSKLYDAWVETQVETEVSPVMRETALVDGFDISDPDARESFAERIEAWRKTERLVRAVDGLLLRNNFDQAIVRCQDALEIDPAHMGALERLGRLYYEKEMYVEAINTYVRLLSLNPARADLQKAVIQALSAHGDAAAVLYMASWYLEQNNYNEDIQRYKALALFRQEEYDKAAEAFSRVLKDAPGDTQALELQADSYMRLEQFDKALAMLERLNSINYRDENCYRNIAVCHAQLGHSLETVQTLGKAAHLFGQQVVVGWVGDPMLNPVRQDRTFQAFADRVGGEEFRKWLETVAHAMEEQGKNEVVAPLLSLPEKRGSDKEMLKPDR